MKTNIYTLSDETKALIERAKQGKAMAQWELGEKYFLGEDGLRKNYEEAVAWYSKAAQQRLPLAQNSLGYMYDNGFGVSQNFQEAFKWYSLAANQDLAKAQCNLGLQYMKGKGVLKNMEKALDWLKSAAKGGFVQAMVVIGSIYQDGDGVDKNLDEAKKWFTNAADSYFFESRLLLMRKKFLNAVQIYQKAQKLGKYFAYKEALVNTDEIPDLLQLFLVNYRHYEKYVNEYTKNPDNIDALKSLQKQIEMFNDLVEEYEGEGMLKELTSPQSLKTLSAYVVRNHHPIFQLAIQDKSLKALSQELTDSVANSKFLPLDGNRSVPEELIEYILTSEDELSVSNASVI